MKGSFVALAYAMFALSMPLYADPGGSPSVGAQSSAMISSFQDQAFAPAASVASAVQPIPAPAESSKSIVTQIAGGVAAVLVGILLVMVVNTLMAQLRSYRRRSEYNLSFGSSHRLKRTKSPVLKMRAAS